MPDRSEPSALRRGETSAANSAERVLTLVSLDLVASLSAFCCALFWALFWTLSLAVIFAARFSDLASFSLDLPFSLSLDFSALDLATLSFAVLASAVVFVSLKVLALVEMDFSSTDSAFVVRAITSRGKAASKSHAVSSASRLPT